MTPVNDINGDGASTFAKGLRVLECFAGGASGLTMAEVARRSGLDRAAARRLCLTLIDSGYLVQTGRGLDLTARILPVAAGYLSRHQIGRLVQPVLNQAAEDLGGEIALAVRDGERAVYVARSATARARVTLGFSVGSTLPLSSTAVGRMLLAQSEDPARATVAAGGPEAAEAEGLRGRVEAARAAGYAHVQNEFELGAAGLAVPCGRLGAAVAVVGTTAPAGSFDTPEKRDPVLAILRRAAMNLGLSGPPRD